MKYKVGDKVRIKTWESLVREFGLVNHRNINVKYGVLGEMKKHCGKDVLVKNVHHDYYELELDDERCWSWYKDTITDATPELEVNMLVKIRNGSVYVVTKNSLSRVGGFLHSSDYFNDLKHESIDDFDIMEIYVCDNMHKLYKDISNFGEIRTDNAKLIWERNPITELTVEEIEERLGYKVKIVEG